LASSYAPLFAALPLAVDEVNAAGGILGRKVVLNSVDDQGDPSQEPAVARQLISGKVSYITGPIGDSAVEASLALTTPAKIVQASYVQSDFGGDGTLYPYHYQFFFNTTTEGQFLADYMVNTLGVKKIGFLQISGAIGNSTLAAVQKVLPPLGASIVSTQVVTNTTPSLLPFVTKLRQAGAEGVIMTLGSVPVNNLAYEAFIQLNWFPPICSHVTPLEPGVTSKTWPTQLTDNVYCPTIKNFTYPKGGKPNAAAQAFVDKLKTYPYGKEGGLGAATAPFYDFIKLLKLAAEEAKSLDSDAIKKVFDGTRNYAGVDGSISFTPTNHTGISADSIAVARASSASNPLCQGYFYEQA
jgi:branched-chain amino acid transport system substrate-binding protein